MHYIQLFLSATFFSLLINPRTLSVKISAPAPGRLSIAAFFKAIKTSLCVLICPGRVFISYTNNKQINTLKPRRRKEPQIFCALPPFILAVCNGNKVKTQQPFFHLFYHRDINKSRLDILLQKIIQTAKFLIRKL